MSFCCQIWEKLVVCGPVIRWSCRGATEHVGIRKPVVVMGEGIELLGCFGCWCGALLISVLSRQCALVFLLKRSLISLGRGRDPEAHAWQGLAVTFSCQKNQACLASSAVGQSENHCKYFLVLWAYCTTVWCHRILNWIWLSSMRLRNVWFGSVISTWLWEYFVTFLEWQICFFITL